VYNSIGAIFTPLVPAGNPITPVTSHTIGTNNGATGFYWFVGDMERILLYNRQLSDAEAQQNCNWLVYEYALSLPALVCNQGDSILFGAGGTPNCPTEVATQLLPTNYIYIFNQAVSGTSSIDCVNNLTTQVLNLYQPKVKNVYYLMIGHNDVANGSVTPAQYIANIQNIGNQVRAKGFKFIMMTILYSASYTNATCDSYNTLIRSGWTNWADALLDANQLPNLINPTNLTYYNADGIHPTSLGSQQIATALEPIIQSFL
jgi:lysophospholipase L1-like esterase